MAKFRKTTLILIDVSSNINVACGYFMRRAIFALPCPAVRGGVGGDEDAAGWFSREM